MTRAATVEGDDRLRLFLALALPNELVEELERWAQEHVTEGRSVGTYHVTLAFLGSQPRGCVGAVSELLVRECAATSPFALTIERYRETRSVGMLVLGDETGGASSLALRLQTGLETLGLYERERRPWLPHITVVRFRERAGLDPPLPATRTFVPSGAAALLSRLHPSGARYEVLTSCPIGR